MKVRRRINTTEQIIDRSARGFRCDINQHVRPEVREGFQGFLCNIGEPFACHSSH